ncbi:hypothetical protein G6F68_014118 [Rhizopus microsporus]|nr:hypothetical protein G6F68_014118 [Rhizopus microsporus]
MFDVTDGRVEKVMMAFREELEEVEGVHQADWEMSELQHDKIEKLFDVFERIDGRYCGLELLADEMIDEIERLRKAVSRRTEPDKVDENDVGLCIVQLSQTLFILQAAPVIDGTLHVREDKMRLCQDIQSSFTQVIEFAEGG